MKKFIIILFFVLFKFDSVFSDINYNSLQIGSDYEYTIRLSNGDILTGSVIEFISTPSKTSNLVEDGIRFRTEIGNAIIYFNQISEIRFSEKYYRHNHRIFLMPTANSIKDNHYAGFFELLYLQAGFGITDYFSFYLGRTIIPSIPESHQITQFNAKATLYDEYFPEFDRGIAFALGANLGFANSANRLIHFYGTGTFKMTRSQISANVFYKAGSQDYFTFSLRENIANVIYPDGAFGVSMGLDTKLPERNDIHIIGELWNNDIARPTHSAMLLGFRICNTKLSADFGLILFTNPYVVPFASFVWTPF